jgi:hypothetical protein
MLILVSACTKREPPPSSLRRVGIGLPSPPARRHLPDHERAERLLEVAQAVVSTLEVEAVLTRVLEVARELTGAPYAALGVLDERRAGLSRFLTIGIDEETRARKSGAFRAVTASSAS